MSIKDRLAQITKSYLNSASETISNELKHVLDKVEKGTLTNDLLDKIQGFKSKILDEEDLYFSEADLDDFLYKEEPKFNKTQSFKPKKTNSKLKEAYKRLGLKNGASVAEAEKAYKKLMKEYHPDRFANNKEKLKLATQISQMLAEALDIIKKAH